MDSSNYKFKQLKPNTDSQLEKISRVKNMLSVVQAYHAAAIFLDLIWEGYKENFSKNDYDYFSQVCSHFCGDPASIDDWRNSYLMVTRRELEDPANNSTLQFYPLLDLENMTSEKAFETLQAMAIWHHRDFGFEFPQLLSLFDSMIKNPSSHETEWSLWNQAIQRGQSGEIMGYG